MGREFKRRLRTADRVAHGRACAAPHPPATFCQRALDMASPRLILASTSPRRRTLLAAAGIEFELCDSGVEEERLANEPAAEFALRMAAEKALAVSRRIGSALVLGADTVVECGGEILGKPRDHPHPHHMPPPPPPPLHTPLTP